MFFMKKYLALLFFSFISLLVKSQTFTLNITKGYGSGTYQKGDTIQIWSFADKNRLTFNQWQGSATPYMLEENEWLTRISVPVNDTVSNINAIASFKILKSTVKSGHQEILLPGMDEGLYIPTLKKIVYQIPENPKGIIFCFHDTDESVDEFETDFEKRSFFKAGANQNYIMIATEANEAAFGKKDSKWQIKNSLTDNENNNIDIHTIKMLRDTIINRYNLPYNIPSFSVGVSNGANFGDLCAAALNFNASAHLIGNGLHDIYKNRSDATAVIFIESINAKDESGNPNSALNNHKILLSREIESKFLWHTRTPLYSQRFFRTSNLPVSKEVSDSIVRRLQRDRALLDIKNQLLLNNNSELPEKIFDHLGLSEKLIVDCKNQIKIMNAENQFNSHYNYRILNFFNIQVNISPRDSTLKKEIGNGTFKNTTNNSFFLNMDKHTSISVLSSSGKLVYQVKGISEINMNPFPKGVYYIKKNNSGKTTVEIVVKEK